MPELKPVEAGPLPPRTTGVATLVIEAGNIRGENRCSPLEAHEFSRGRKSPAFGSETGDLLEVRHVTCGHTLFMGQGDGSNDEVEITNRTTAQGGIVHEF